MMDVQKQPPDMFCKKSLEISQNSQENTYAGGLTQVLSCEFCELSKNTLFTEHLWARAPEYNNFNGIL